MNRSTHNSRRGFSFTEVLFAIMILGIGFIMVAAIFPVAIQQSRTSSEETTGATVARGGAGYLERVATNSVMPATNNVVVGPDFDAYPPTPPLNREFRDTFTLATALRGSLVVAADQRYAWIPFYRRAGDPQRPETWSPFAQVFMIPVMNRNDPDYLKGGPLVAQWKTGVPGTARTRGTIIDGINGAPDVLSLATDRDVASEGAYVIIADAWHESDETWNLRVAPQLQGRIYRLGNPVPAGNPEDLPTDWELMPGFDFEPIRVDYNGKPNDGAPPNRADGKEMLVGSQSKPLGQVSFFIVGRGISPVDPSMNNPSRAGTAQDISAYTTFVTVK